MADKNITPVKTPALTFGELSDEERQAWFAKVPKASKLGFKAASKAWMDTEYIDIFGRKAFDSTPDRATREQQVRDYKVDKTVDSAYKNDANYGEIQELSTEGKLELLNSRYDEVKESAEKTRKLGENEWFKAGTLMAGSAATNLISSRKDFNANAILGEISARDTYRKGENVKQVTSSIATDTKQKLSSGEVSEQEVNDTIAQIFEGGKQTVQDEFGTREITLPGSAYYRAFKDAHELEQLSFEDKINLLSEYFAVEQKYGAAAAVKLLDTKIRDFVYDHQNAWDFISSAAAGAATKGAANTANRALQLVTWYKRAFEGEESLANFLEGKDKYGNEFNGQDFWKNPLYWNAVDQLGSFSPEYLKTAQENGGISKYNWISKSDEQRSLATAVNESFKMAGYMMSDALFYAGMAYAGGALGVTIAPELLGGLSSLGISHAYASGTYEQVLQEANAKIDSKIAKDADAYIQEKLNNIDKDTQGLINGYVNRRANELLASNSNLKASDIDYDSLAQEAMNQYAQAEYQRYMDTHKDDYADDREMARSAATTAYMADSITEWMRMSLANVTYRKFLMDPGSKAILAKRFPTKGVIQKAEELGTKYTSKLGKAGPILNSIWGGARDNYLDDVNVAWAKAIGLGKFDRYLESELSPSQYAASTDFLTRVYQGVYDGMRGARQGFVDSQSFYDGMIGGLGTILSFYPSSGLFSAKSRFVDADVNRLSALRNMTPRQYLKSDFVREDVANEQLRQKSWAERFSQYVSNPAIQQWAEQTANERELDTIVNETNKVVANKKQAIHDIVRLAGKVNTKLANEDSLSEADIKDAKLAMGFATIQTLNEWANDPIASQHPIVQQYTQELQNASKGNISEDMINDFLNAPENKSIKESNNGADIARQRIQSNAKQLLSIKEKYDSFMNKLKSSKDYLEIEREYGAEEVATQLAFNNVLASSRRERLQEMNKDINGTSNISEMSSPVALYGSEKGRQRFENAQKETIKSLENDIAKIQKELKDLDSTPEGQLARLSLESSLRLTQRQLAEEKETLRNIEALKDSDEFNTVLSKEAILSLNPMERARMLQETDNPAEYSAAQQKEINVVRSELRAKDPTLLEKVKDAGTVYSRLKDLEKANDRMQSDMLGAAHALAYAASSRALGVARAYEGKIQEQVNSLLDAVPNDDTTTLIATGKRVHSSRLNKYIEANPERKAVLEPIVNLRKTVEDAERASDQLYSDPKVSKEYKKLINSTAQREHILNEEQFMSALEDVIDSQSNKEDADALNAIMEKLVSYNHTRNATKVQERAKRQEEQAKREAEAPSTREEEKTSEETPVGHPDDKQAGKGLRLAFNEDGSVKTNTPQEEIGDAGDSASADVISTTNESPEEIGNPPKDNIEALQGVMIGNTLYEYEPDGLANAEIGQRLAVRQNAYGAKETYYKWEDDTNSNVQAIIDSELSRIISKNPNTKVHLVRAKNYGNIIFEAIEFTDNVKSIHNENLGGVIQIGGKQYLVIGTFGYNPKVSAMQEAYDSISKQTYMASKAFFDAQENSSESYWIDPIRTTKIDEIYSGWIVDGFSEEELGQKRTIGELMKDKLTNPYGLTLRNAVFGIMHTKDKFVTYGKTDDRRVLPPKNTEDTVGLVFMLVPSSSGVYIPISLLPANLNEIAEGSPLRKVISQHIHNLTSDSLSKRRDALQKLSEYLVFTKDGDNIRVRDNVVEIVKDGNVVKTFTVDGVGVNAGVIEQEIINNRFRINVSPKVLRDSNLLKLYDDSGALRTTAAKLGTVNASFNVLMIDRQGNPIEKQVPQNQSIPEQSSVDLTKGNKVTVDNVEYTEVNGKYYDSTGNEVKNSNLKKKLAYQRHIDKNNIQPIISDANGDIYALQTRDGNYIVLTISKDGKMTFKNKENSQKFMNDFNAKKEQAVREQAAKEALEKQKQLEEQAKKAQEAKEEDPLLSAFGPEVSFTQQARGVDAQREKQSLNPKELSFTNEDFTKMYSRAARSNGDLRQAFNQLPEAIQELFSNVQKAPKVAPEQLEGFKERLISWALKNENNPMADALLGIVNPKELQEPSPKEEKLTPKQAIDRGIATNTSIKEIQDSKNSYNFTRAFASRNSNTRKAVMSFLERKGATAKTPAEVFKFLKDRGIDYEMATSENVLIEMLNNCK